MAFIPTRTSNDERRVIVIGSGPSGAMAALALVRQGIPVTLLESGQNVPSGLLVRAMGKNVYRRRRGPDNSRQHIASDDPDTAWYHALAPGGLSNYWTGAVPRFAPEDFCEGERLHERYRWPVSYDELVPYYEVAERLLVVAAAARDVPGLPASHVSYHRRLAGPWRRVAGCAESFGQGLTPLPLADGPPWMVSRTGVSFNSYTRIVPRLRRFAHFELLLGAHAIRLEWSGATKKVDGVVYVDRAAGVEQRLNCAAVVVAAGPLASTKLLLQSACGDFPAGLGDTEGILGRFLHDHLNPWCVVDVETPLPRLTPAAYLTRAPYRESAPLLAASCTLGGASHARLQKVLALTPVRAQTFGVNIFGTMVPTHDTYVRLDSSATDDFGLPVLDIHIRHDEGAQRAVAAARDRLVAILDAAGYPCMVRDVTVKAPGAAAHYGGTVRMHSSPTYGMLNAWNRLHAIDNVAVVDASCFTTGVEKNPTLTAMALAARAGDRLARDLKTS